jgi:hypothetical protein
MHPIHPAMASDSMRARSGELRPTVSRRRLPAAARFHRPAGPRPWTNLRARAGWQLIRVGLRLAVSPR